MKMSWIRNIYRSQITLFDETVSEFRTLPTLMKRRDWIRLIVGLPAAIGSYFALHAFWPGVVCKETLCIGGLLIAPGYMLGAKSIRSGCGHFAILAVVGMSALMDVENPLRQVFLHARAAVVVMWLAFFVGGLVKGCAIRKRG